MSATPSRTRACSTSSTKISALTSRYSPTYTTGKAEKNILLQTIKLPKNLRLLRQKLPKSKYDASQDGHVSFDEKLIDNTILNENVQKSSHRKVPKKNQLQNDRKSNRNSSYD